MDPAQLSDSANLLLSATGVLAPVSQVLTIAVDKHSEEVETLPQTEAQIEVPVGETEGKIQVEQSVDDQIATILADKGLGAGSFSNKPIEKTISALAESQNTMAIDNLQYVIVRVKASETVGMVRKLVADSIHVPVETSTVFYRDIQVSEIPCLHALDIIFTPYVSISSRGYIRSIFSGNLFKIVNKLWWLHARQIFWRR
jgi:hypothetical protein